MRKFYGTGVAMVIPLDDSGQIGYPALERLINYLIAGGVKYLVSLGKTGESATLTKDEKKAIWAFTSKINNGRVNLIAGIGGNNTTETVKEIKRF